MLIVGCREKRRGIMVVIGEPDVLVCCRAGASLRLHDVPGAVHCLKLSIIQVSCCISAGAMTPLASALLTCSFINGSNLLRLFVSSMLLLRSRLFMRWLFCCPIPFAPMFMRDKSAGLFAEAKLLRWC